MQVPTQTSLETTQERVVVSRRNDWVILHDKNQISITRMMLRPYLLGGRFDERPSRNRPLDHRNSVEGFEQNRFFAAALVCSPKARPATGGSPLMISGHHRTHSQERMVADRIPHNSFEIFKIGQFYFERQGE